MKFEVNIDKKFAFMILGAILILAGAIYGYAFGGSEPDVMGHSLGELEGVQARVTGVCSAGSSIRVIDAGGGVTCETDDVGSGGIQSIAVSSLYTVVLPDAWATQGSTYVGSHDVCFLETFKVQGGQFASDTACWKSGNTIYISGSQGDYCKYRCLDW